MPQTLSKKGQAVSKSAGAKQIAKDEAPKLAERALGASKYGVQELSIQHMICDFDPPDDVRHRMEAAAYKHGVGLVVVKYVVATELRDILFKMDEARMAA